ncbi:twin-arginine translocase subunit TatC [Leucobacter manosquensis]|uniref:Sec-independent protein translocase protein TatC n=1 Tax=Leucobacter manosquensis TaxID=2810611 RepID=A0ABS5M2W4_9MICO|nr:twin-arginine translocase subunit TatC [Leucobacter manosquensis]MBS3181353.1 twin-arginine translocase subunit TatC [Leucobacter manosquensis]
MANQARKRRSPDGRMSLGEHLIEFRKRLLISAAAIVIALIAGWFLSTWVWEMLRKPINDLEMQGRDAIISYGDISSGFDTKVQIALFIAVLIASPVWLYQVWAFLAPGLTRREKLTGVGFIGAAVPLFLGGAYAGWLVLPNIVRLMASFQPEEDAFYLTARNYLDFAIKLLLAVGVGFVLPVLLVMLNFIGVLRGAAIIRSWRVAILVIILFAAIATPAADLMSMFLLAAPIIVLYFAAAGVALLHDRRVDKRRSAELAEYDLDDDTGREAERGDADRTKGRR